MAEGKRIAIFDLDGTLSPATRKVPNHVKDALYALKAKGYDLAVASGATYSSVEYQLGHDLLAQLSYVFSQNGTQTYSRGKLVHGMSIHDAIKNDDYIQLVNFCLHYIADLSLPIKRGTFLECRESVLNICPVGRNCSAKERAEFAELDKQTGIRAKLVNELEKRFGYIQPPLNFSIGGQISIDCFPKGWDKSYLMQFVKDYETIHFFGDRTQPGGNDYELFHQEGVIGHTVLDFEDTIKQINTLL